MSDREPIVDAVLKDPVVKAVLEDPKASSAVADAISPGAGAAVVDVVDAVEAVVIPPAVVDSVAPVSVTAGQVVQATSKPDVVRTPAGNLVAAPTSTEEEERTGAGQRETSLLWETTQAKIAIAVVYTVLIVAAALSIAGMTPWAGEKQIALAITAFMLLSSLSTLVIGFYYGRTNHQKVGGSGAIAGR